MLDSGGSWVKWMGMRPPEADLGRKKYAASDICWKRFL